MGDPADKRTFKRLQTEWIVRLRAGSASEDTRAMLKARLCNISAKGVFIEANFPYDPGSIVEFDFTIPGTRQIVHARGIVRWSNDGSDPGQPQGMGIEFIELTAESRDRIKEYVEREDPESRMKRLIRTPAHKRLLKLYREKIGEFFSLELLEKFLQCPKDDLMDALSDYQQSKLVKRGRDKVEFLSPEDPALARRIAEWVEETPKP